LADGERCSWRNRRMIGGASSNLKDEEKSLAVGITRFGKRFPVACATNPLKTATRNSKRPLLPYQPFPDYSSRKKNEKRKYPTNEYFWRNLCMTFSAIRMFALLTEYPAGQFRSLKHLDGRVWARRKLTISYFPDLTPEFDRNVTKLRLETIIFCMYGKFNGIQDKTCEALAFHSSLYRDAKIASTTLENVWFSGSPLWAVSYYRIALKIDWSVVFQPEEILLHEFALILRYLTLVFFEIPDKWRPIRIKMYHPLLDISGLKKSPISLTAQRCFSARFPDNYHI